MVATGARAGSSSVIAEQLWELYYRVREQLREPLRQLDHGASATSNLGMSRAGISVFCQLFCQLSAVQLLFGGEQLLIKNRLPIDNGDDASIVS